MFELLVFEPRVYIQAVLAWTICLAALVWGGGPERAVAVTWLVVFELGGRILSSVFEVRFQLLGVDAWLVSMDFIAGAVWVAIALYANRTYTLGIAAMQVLAMTAHLARGLVETIAPVAYIAMVATPGWFQLLFLAVGLTRHILRRRVYGDYRDWRLTKWTTAPFLSSRDSKRLVSLPDVGASQNWRDEIK